MLCLIDRWVIRLLFHFFELRFNKLFNCYFLFRVVTQCNRANSLCDNRKIIIFWKKWTGCLKMLQNLRKIRKICPLFLLQFWPLLFVLWVSKFSRFLSTSWKSLTGRIRCPEEESDCFSDLPKVRCTFSKINNKIEKNVEKNKMKNSK